MSEGEWGVLGPNALNEILVVTDMDGTLLRGDKTISPCDLETIRLFTALGGHFSVATGRTVSSVEMYPELAAVIGPGIACGGCLTYDFQNKKTGLTHLLPYLAARQSLRDIMGTFPTLGVMVMSADLRLYALNPSKELQILIDDEEMGYFIRPPDEVVDEWNKVLFAGPPSLLAEVADYLSTRTYPGLHFVMTNEQYYEMMPKGVSKGSALYELCEQCGISIRNTYAIGDYYNDIDIMKQAGYAVAMRNAPDEVKAVANAVTASNEESGVAQFLYELIKRYEQ